MKATATASTPGSASFRGSLPGRLVIEREPHLSRDVDALRNREAKLPRHQRFRLLDHDVVLVEAALVRDLEHIAKALARDQRRRAPLALDDRVGRERRAVNEHFDVIRTRAPPRPAPCPRLRSAPAPEPPPMSALSSCSGRPASSAISVNVPPISAARRTRP